MDEQPTVGAGLRGSEEGQPPSDIQAPSSSHVKDLGPSPHTTPSVGASEPVPSAISATSPAIGESEINGDDDSTPSKRCRLRRRSEVPSVAESDLVAAAMEPLTDEERQNWPGWVELESDPVNLPLPFRTFKPVKL
jgi:ubiquitin carboxyl-terminal hydrolase L5